MLNDIELNRVPYAWVAVPLWLCRMLSWGTLVFEIGFPFLVLSPAAAVVVAGRPILPPRHLGDDGGRMVQPDVDLLVLRVSQRRTVGCCQGAVAEGGP